MVASLDETLLFVLTGLGVMSMAAGLVLLFRGGARREEQVVEFLGWKFQFTSAGLVVFLIGRLHAQSWLDSLQGSNPFAVAAFSMLTLMAAGGRIPS